jgi:hypothetical protein
MESTNNEETFDREKYETLRHFKMAQKHREEVEKYLLQIAKHTKYIPITFWIAVCAACVAVVVALT